MKLLHMICRLLFPPKCVLCKKLLEDHQQGLCTQCRIHTPEARTEDRKIPHLAKCSALWYYEADVRSSLLRYKFLGQRSYANTYGSLLAMKILQECPDFDLLTWIPISRLRKWRRGFDQVELLARVAAKELNVPLTPTLKKRRNNRAQSGIKNAAARRANVLGIYQPVCPEAISGKRIVLLDDIMTTGATAGECARTLLTAGARQVHCFTVAVSNQRKNSR